MINMYEKLKFECRLLIVIRTYVYIGMISIYENLKFECPLLIEFHTYCRDSRNETDLRRSSVPPLRSLQAILRNFSTTL